MKTYKHHIMLPVEWSFCCDGMTMRSTVVGGYQGEIFKSYLRIYGHGYHIRCFVGSRANGMKTFDKKLALLLGSEK